VTAVTTATLHRVIFSYVLEHVHGSQPSVEIVPALQYFKLARLNGISREYQ
jgi:hypothetical protein